MADVDLSTDTAKKRRNNNSAHGGDMTGGGHSPQLSDGWVVSNAQRPTGTEDRQCTGGADVFPVVR